jgi:hypothetical protein
MFAHRIVFIPSAIRAVQRLGARVITIRNEAASLDDAPFENVAKPIARRFGVSPAAMRIRLDKLGLLPWCLPEQSWHAVGP